MLLYNGRYEHSNDYIAWRLVDGIPLFEFSPGNEQVYRVALPRHEKNRVDDGRWHKIEVRYDERSVTLRTDECDIVLATKHGRYLGENEPQCAAVLEDPLQTR